MLSSQSFRPAVFSPARPTHLVCIVSSIWMTLSYLTSTSNGGSPGPYPVSRASTSFCNSLFIVEGAGLEPARTLLGSRAYRARALTIKLPLSNVVQNWPTLTRGSSKACRGRRPALNKTNSITTQELVNNYSLWPATTSFKYFTTKSRMPVSLELGGLRI